MPFLSVMLSVQDHWSFLLKLEKIIHLGRIYTTCLMGDYQIFHQLFQDIELTYVIHVYVRQIYKNPMID